ncbi:MAG: Smr/MutS family protein [Candidatus Lambdaproteobacteria bacterium]|nr:Smr/MutS family protein [Candidatus Lambdaproteobacteria bacterium]
MDHAAPPPDHTLANLTWPAMMAALLRHTITPPGRAAAQILSPLPDATAAAEALAHVGELAALLAERGRLPLRGVEAIGELLGRAHLGGMLLLDELGRVLATQRAARACAQKLAEPSAAPRLAALGRALAPLGELTALLERAIAPTGELSGSAYPELDALRREIVRRREAIHRRLDELLRGPALAPHVQERLHTLRGARYVIPLKAEARRHLPGIVHDVSASGQTVYVEPQQVVEETNALTMAEKALQRETERILRLLSAAVGEASAGLAHNLALLGRLDLLQAQALLAQAYGGSVPQVGDEGRVRLRGVAHPLLLLEGHAVVRNDLALEPPQRCMVISGANTGGKTVLLTSIGLCALLVRHGMPIPAQPGSRMDFFAQVSADVGDQQSLSESLSTFSAQVAFLAGLLARAGTGYLVLIDEILTGTEPREGAALAAAVVEALVARGATVFATTHYGDLKRLAAENPAVCNASVSFDAERLQPTFRLLPGLPGASYAFPIAQRHGLPDALVRAAEQRLADRPQAVEALLAELHAQGRRLDARDAELAQEARRQESLAGQLAAREGRVTELERRVRQAERAEIGRELRAAKRRIARVVRGLQAANSLPVVEQVRQELAQVERELLPPAGPPPPAPEALTPQALRALNAGAPLRVLSLDRVGTLLEVLDEGRRARVALGNLTVLAEPGDLAPHAPTPQHTARRARQAAATRSTPATTAVAAAQQAQAGASGFDVPGPPGIGPVLSHSENTLDVRGERLEEAVAQADRFFDLCVMKHVSPVVVIHGHGTGRLRTGLRGHFAESPYVAAIRPGAHGEGSDGVTVVALNL